jgi:hypothetical protein
MENKHYLIILEDFSTFKTNRLNIEELESAKEDYLVIIDITDPANPKNFEADGDWTEVLSWASD